MHRINETKRNDTADGTPGAEAFDHLERRLRAQLSVAHVPPAEETWRALERRLAPHAVRPQARMRGLRLAVAVVIVLTATAGAVLAASPDLRESLRTAVVGGRGAGDQLASLHPTPSFAVFQPTYLPEGMRLISYAYAPGEPSPAAGASPPRPSPGLRVSAQRLGGHEVNPVTLAAVEERVRQLGGDGRDPTLVLIYAGDAGAVVEVVQRPAQEHALPPGARVTVHDAPAVLVQDEGDEGRRLLVWREQGTYLELHTTLPLPEAVRVADSLQRTPLETFQGAAMTPPAVVPPAGAPPAAPAGPGAPEPPLAARIGAVTAPRVSQETLVQQCGPWDPTLSRTNPPASAQQALCVGRVVAGIEPGTAHGLSRLSGREAVERLGLNPGGVSAALIGHPAVWLAQFTTGNRPGSGSRVVILDAHTGEPYLLVELAPA